MKKLTLSGYGKMGKEIEALAPQYGFQIHTIIDQEQDWLDKGKKIKESDVIIDFSIPKVALQNIHHALDLKVPMVIGTTGWHDHLEEIKQVCIQSNNTLIYASNFSVGVNIFFKLNQYLAELMNPQTDYSVMMEETHHTQKLDSPSGTAITLANQIIEKLDKKTDWINEFSSNNDLLPIISHREAQVTGTHEVHYQSDIDKITIAHQAYNRKGFASGALLAAKWATDLKGFYTFDELLFNKD